MIMLYTFRLPALLAVCSLVSACAGSGGGLGVPDCAPDQGVVEAPKVRAGDVWTYRQINDYTKVDQGVFRLEATGVTANDIQARLTVPGAGVVSETYDLQWGWKNVSNRGWDWLSRLASGSATVEFRPPFDSMPFPLQVGKRWSDTVVATNPATRGQISIQVSSTARCWEKISVPVGAFAALRIERTAYVQDVAWNKSQTTLRMVDWYSPDINRVVMTWHDSYYYDYQQDPRNALIRGDRLRWDLIEYKAAK
jgi:hypothetical protein